MIVNLLPFHLLPFPISSTPIPTCISYTTISPYLLQFPFHLFPFLYSHFTYSDSSHSSILPFTYSHSPQRSLDAVNYMYCLRIVGSAIISYTDWHDEDIQSTLPQIEKMKLAVWILLCVLYVDEIDACMVLVWHLQFLVQKWQTADMEMPLGRGE